MPEKGVLRARIVTALALGLFAIWLVWGAPAVVLPAAFVVITALAAREWAGLAGLCSRSAVAFYALMAAALVAALALLAPSREVLLILGALAWLGGLGWLAIYASGREVRGDSRIRAGAGVTLPGAAGHAVISLHVGTHGAYWLTQLGILVCGSDVGGFVAGRAVGRRKLAPRVSPAKTWEGVGGSLVLGLGGAALFHMVMARQGAAPEIALPIGLGGAVLVIAVAIAGDLFESMLKRQAAVKDSGRLLPGHGGILDRLDALLPAATMLAALILVVNGP